MAVHCMFTLLHLHFDALNKIILVRTCLSPDLLIKTLDSVEILVEFD